MTPCLDHQPTRDANGKPLPAVTGKHYNYAQRKNMEAKRKVLDRWAADRAGSSARRNPSIWNSSRGVRDAVGPVMPPM